MQGLATRTMLQHINTNPLPDDILAPECEAPPTGHLSPVTDHRDSRDPEARVFFRGALMIFCLLGIFAITVRDIEVRSQPPAPALTVPAATWAHHATTRLAPGESTYAHDFTEDCVAAAHRDTRGNVVIGQHC
jgi:hypothetical protein